MFAYSEQLTKRLASAGGHANAFDYFELGQGPPMVDVAFRRFDGRDQVFDDEFLKLTIADARELAVALNYLIEIAERG